MPKWAFLLILFALASTAFDDYEAEDPIRETEAERFQDQSLIATWSRLQTPAFSSDNKVPTADKTKYAQAPKILGKDKKPSKPDDPLPLVEEKAGGKADKKEQKKDKGAASDWGEALYAEDPEAAIKKDIDFDKIEKDRAYKELQEKNARQDDEKKSGSKKRHHKKKDDLMEEEERFTANAEDTTAREGEGEEEKDKEETKEEDKKNDDKDEDDEEDVVKLQQKLRRLKKLKKKVARQKRSKSSARRHRPEDSPEAPLDEEEGPVVDKADKAVAGGGVSMDQLKALIREMTAPKPSPVVLAQQGADVSSVAVDLKPQDKENMTAAPSWKAIQEFVFREEREQTEKIAKLEAQVQALEAPRAQDEAKDKALEDVITQLKGLSGTLSTLQQPVYPAAPRPFPAFRRLRQRRRQRRHTHHSDQQQEEEEQGGAAADKDDEDEDNSSPTKEDDQYDYPEPDEAVVVPRFAGAPLQQAYANDAPLVGRINQLLGNLNMALSSSQSKQYVTPVQPL